MSGEGPALAVLQRRLADCPASFLDDTVDAAAVLSDLLVDLGGAPLDDAEAARLAAGAGARNRVRTALVAAHLLHDRWFLDERRFAAAARALLLGGLDELAQLVAAPSLVADPDRREELARRCLRALDLRPAGETAAVAEDRFGTVDTVERRRVVRESEAAERRAQEVREAMARQAAEESVAAYDRG